MGLISHGLRKRCAFLPKKESPPVTPCHGFPVHQGNPAPDPRAVCSISSTATRFQLLSKGCSREGIAFVLVLGPLLIGLPQISGTAPGARMQFTAGIQKLLQRIILRRSRSDGFVKRGRDSVLMALASMWVWNCLRTVVRCCLDLWVPLFLNQVSIKLSGGHRFRVNFSQRLRADLQGA